MRETDGESKILRTLSDRVTCLRPLGATPMMEETMQTDTDRAAILALMESERKAHQAKDGAAIVSHFTRDAVIFDLSPPLLSPLGTDAEAMQGWLDTWNGPVDLAPRDMKVTISGDSAFAHGFLELSGWPKAAEGEKISLWMRATLCFARVGDDWKIVHEHTSVPFRMDGSFEAALDLKP
jgi:ketosteroid isomerase-like protein